jgi:hypothetical protein
MVSSVVHNGTDTTTLESCRAILINDRLAAVLYLMANKITPGKSGVVYKK